MSEEKASEREIRRGVTFSKQTLKAAKRITDETRLSLPALIELLIESASEYQASHGAFPTPFRLVPEMEYRRFLEIQHLTSPESFRDLMQGYGLKVAEDKPQRGKRKTAS